MEVWRYGDIDVNCASLLASAFDSSEVMRYHHLQLLMRFHLV